MSAPSPCPSRPGEAEIRALGVRWSLRDARSPPNGAVRTLRGPSHDGAVQAARRSRDREARSASSTAATHDPWRASVTGEWLNRSCAVVSQGKSRGGPVCTSRVRHRAPRMGARPLPVSPIRGLPTSSWSRHMRCLSTPLRQPAFVPLHARQQYPPGRPSTKNSVRTEVAIFLSGPQAEQKAHMLSS
jgi:hypothetical protein